MISLLQLCWVIWWVPSAGLSCLCSQQSVNTEWATNLKLNHSALLSLGDLLVVAHIYLPRNRDAEVTAKLSLKNTAVSGKWNKHLFCFPQKLSFSSFFLERLHLLEFKAQLHQTREFTTHPSCIRCAATSQLHFRLNGKLGPRTTLGTGSGQRGGGMVMATLISSLIADLAAVPQRTILKALNSKYSYLTHLK